MKRWTVQVGDAETSAVYEAAAPARHGPLDALLVLAHGAGSHMEHPSTVALASELRSVGFDTLRFDFLYRALGRKAPDRMPKLLDCWRAVVELARRELAPERLVIGGRSMGGRAASMLAADGFEADGLALFAYPLHPPSKLDRLRAEHLARITMPTLILNGTRDALCDRETMDAVAAGLPSNVTLHWLEHADHGFHVPKRSGRSDEDVLDEVGRTTREWFRKNF